MDRTAGLTVAQEWQLLLTTLDQLRITNYSLASALTFLVYDTVCNSPSEIALIWRAKWSFPKFLYIFARYWGIFYLGFELGVSVSVTLDVNGFNNLLPILSVLTLPVAASFGSVSLSSGFVAFTTTVNIIFLLRIHALYNRSRKVLALLIGLVLLEFGTELYVTLMQALENNVIPRPLPFVSGCIISNGVTNRELVAWIPNLLVGFSFFVLTIIKLYQTLRDRYPQSGGVLQLTSQQIKGSLGPMLTMFIRDGALFFALLFGISVVCAVMTSVFKDSSLLTLAYPWLVGVYAYSGSRLILNLRSVLVAKANPTSFGPNSLELSNRMPKLPTGRSAPTISLSFGPTDTLFEIPNPASLDLWSQNAFHDESEDRIDQVTWESEHDSSRVTSFDS
ncbi:hypothetical protein SISSUDRAFT_1064169 [Sistotremastrum suecicum HHB10207 ss-3]|uniref:DUF6533 domain-containing protein n=1 Tax=Sistotremastrum suecicum HHB10207 ss-3 TaxID=1314776 RepID=A0A166AZH6_9AGAM|nr:hypothetical protein SISSUDRAFT_1064169 [Sistotremastrum suecicum HHB10207 ss-3]